MIGVPQGKIKIPLRPRGCMERRFRCRGRCPDDGRTWRRNGNKRARSTFRKEPHPEDKPEEWLNEIESLRQTWPDKDELVGITGINPNVLMHKQSQKSDKAVAFVTNVGQHQVWAAQSLELNADQRFLSLSGMGSMGFALLATWGLRAIG